METTMNTKVDGDRKIWFSMWFLGAIVTFGVAFFPMFYRLVDGRNRHFQKEAEIEQKLAEYLRNKGKEPPAANQPFKQRNAKVWAASIILIVPVFVLLYLLSKDLAVHEQRTRCISRRCSPRANIYAPDNTDKNLCFNNNFDVGCWGSVLALQGR